MRIFVAPVQGHTDAVWRSAHRKVYGGDLRYFTPFLRLEGGEVRAKDLRDLTSPLNEGTDLEPQVIFRDMEELKTLIDCVLAQGYNRVNLNMGCPFPPQTAKCRGAGFLKRINELEKLPKLLVQYPEVECSVKMRLGMDAPDEWCPVVDILNTLPLSHLDVHPRVARQQYRGELHLDQFSELLEASKNPVVFNGELYEPSDFQEIQERFPKISGLMTARGILGRPSLAAEVMEGREWSPEERLKTMLRFHNLVLEGYRQIYVHDQQVLTKIKPFWDYAEPEIGHKTHKSIRKSSSLPRYLATISTLGY